MYSKQFSLAKLQLIFSLFLIINSTIGSEFNERKYNKRSIFRTSNRDEDQKETSEVISGNFIIFFNIDLVIFCSSIAKWNT